MKYSVKVIAIILCLLTVGNILLQFSNTRKYSRVNERKTIERTGPKRIENAASYRKDDVITTDDITTRLHHEKMKGNTIDNGYISTECRTILSGSVKDIQNLRQLDDVTNSGSIWRDVTTDNDVMHIAKNCMTLREKYAFPPAGKHHYDVTEEELDYPIAYSILAHQNIHQLVLLLSAVYRTHNLYCIHLDAKSDDVILKTLQAVTKCFPNVFLSSTRVRVVYASVSRLLADIACMKDLLAVPKSMYDWKYLINLCSQDFPLRTNKELVQQLKIFKGINSIGGYAEPSEQVLERTMFVHKVENITKNGKTEEEVIRTAELHSPPPFNMTVRKNLAYNCFTRNFLQWAVEESKEGKALLDWSMDTYSPDEHYWLMLHTYPGAPGGSNLMSGFQLAREIKWSFTNPVDSCYGQWRHYICVFGSENIRNLTKTRNLFVNKLDIRLDSTGVVCLRQWLDERIFLPNQQRMNSNADKNATIPSESFYI